MAINRINETDLQGKLVSQLSNRPTDPRSAGGDNMTAQEVKARHDALGLLVKDKLNEVLDALNNATVGGEPVTPLSDLITVVADGVSKSLTAWIEDKYSLPLTGIPKSDLSDGVKASLDLADSAYQLPETGIPADDLASAVKTILTNALLQSDADMSATGGKLGRRDYSGVLHGATYGASAIDTALVNKGQFEPVKALALGATKAFSVENYTALVTALSSAEKTAYRVGQTIFVGTAEVPDVWIYSVEDSSVSYTYTTDSALEASLVAGTLQIGYFTLRQMETKTDLSDYATTDAVSEAIDALIDALVDGVMAVAEADYAESATYAQQAYIANQINTDREIEDADTACPPAVFGTVGGNSEVQSGLMPFTELRGNTIKWNQLCVDPTFATANKWEGATIADNKATVTGNGSISQAFNMVRTQGNKFALVQNHYYLFAYACTSSYATTNTSLRLFDGTSNWYYPFDAALPVGKTFASKIYKYTGASTDATVYLYANYATGGLPVGETMVFENMQIFDLTEMFGAGKEPATADEFFAQFNKPVYAYNAGQLLSSKSASVILRKKNQCPGLDEYFRVIPGETYEVSGISAGGYLQEYDGNKTLIKTSSEITSATDITLDNKTAFCKLQATTYTIPFCYILWSTPNETPEAYSATTIALPNLELRSAGSVYDVLYQQGGGKRRVGVYTFTGEEDWYKGTTQTTGGLYRYYTFAVTIKQGLAQGGFCNKFDTLGNDYDTVTTGGMMFGYNNSTVYFMSETELTTDEVQALFDSSATIYYPLATETDITTEENPGWDEYIPVDNFGTLQFTQDPAQDIPVPQAYFIRYTVNLVEFLDSLFVHCGGDVSKIALVE